MIRKSTLSLLPLRGWVSRATSKKVFLNNIQLPRGRIVQQIFHEHFAKFIHLIASCAPVLVIYLLCWLLRNDIKTTHKKTTAPTKNDICPFKSKKTITVTLYLRSNKLSAEQPFKLSVNFFGEKVIHTCFSRFVKSNISKTRFVIYFPFFS